MKRLLVGLVVSALFLFGSLAVSAAVSVSGGYLFGTADYDGYDVDSNGIVVRVGGDVADPFGVVVDASFLKDEDEYKITDWNIYATYTPPITITEGLDLKVLAGYGSADTDGFYSDGLTLKGFRVGAAANLKVADKLALDGEVTCGIGTKGEWDVEHVALLSLDEREFDAKSLSYRVAASYEVIPNVAVEAGYLKRSFEADEGPDLSFSGFFVGAKASF